MGYHFQRSDEAAMERLLSHHFSSPEGAILRLAWLQGLSRAEITSLTWKTGFCCCLTVLCPLTLPQKPACVNGGRCTPPGPTMWWCRTGTGGPCRRSPFPGWPAAP